MLKKKKQVADFNKRCKSLILHLNIFCEKKDPETLHHLRVSIKKIKMLLSLNEEIGRSGNWQTHFQGLQDLFKDAGSLRSAAIGIRLAKEHGTVNEQFRREQQKLLLSQTKAFCDKSDVYLNAIFHSYHNLVDDFNDLKNNQLIKHFKKELKQLGRFFGPGMDISKLHPMRMRLKNLSYLHGILSKKLVRTLKFNTTYVDRLQDTIGVWHDATSILEELKTRPKSSVRLVQRLHEIAEAKMKTIQSLSRNFDKLSILRRD
jgi:CHAD domain-containing protein